MVEAQVIPLPGRGLVESIHEMLLDRILSGALQPHQTLLERPLAAELGVSRTPLREALRQLEGERFVGRRDDGSLYVRAITVQEFLEVLHIRSLLEADATGRAAGRIGAADLKALRARLIALKDAGEPDLAEHRRIDDTLHGMIAAEGGGDLMRGLIADLRRRTRMFSMQRMPERFGPVCAEHLAIIDALAAGDASAAAEASRTHFANIRESIIEWLKHS